MVLFFALSVASAVPAPQAIANFPAYFEPNQGQFDKQVRFLARGAKYRAWITDRELVVEIPKQAPARIRFGGPNQQQPLKVEGLEKQIGTSSYYIGNDPAKWTTGVPAYSKAKLNDVYPGIDVVFYEKNREIEYDLIVKPGADPAQISISFGPGWTETPNGDLELGKDLRHKVPGVHQNGTPVRYATRFESGTLRFDVPGGGYDPNQPLTVDPTIVYASYLGGSGQDEPGAIAVDSTGAMYIAGNTNSIAFPGLITPIQGDFDVFVVKIGAVPVNGVHPRLFSAFVGGRGSEFSTCIALDSQEGIYVGGYTGSLDFPVSKGFQSVPGGEVSNRSDGFLFKLSNQSLVYSSYLAGNARDEVRGVAVDPSGSAYVTGLTASNTFPTKNAYQSASAGSMDAFVHKISGTPNPTTGFYDLVYGTFLGTAVEDSAAAIAVTAAGTVVVTGKTGRLPFPAGAARVQAQCEGALDFECVFVTRISATPLSDGSYPVTHSLQLGSGLAGASSSVGLAIDPAGDIYVAGNSSLGLFFVKKPAWVTGIGFVVKISGTLTGGPPAAEILYSTRVPGTAVTAIGVDSTGAAYVVGDALGFEPIDDVEPGGNGGPSVTKISALPNGPNGNHSILYHAGTLKSGFGHRTTPVFAVRPNGDVFLAFAAFEGSQVVNGNGPQNGLDAYALKLIGGRTAPGSVLVRTPGRRVDFTTSGANCNPGTHITPKYFDWPAGARCTISFPASFPAAPNESRYQFDGWADSASDGSTRIIQVGQQPIEVGAFFSLFYRVSTAPTGMTPVVDDYFRAGTVLTFTPVPRQANMVSVLLAGFERWELGPGNYPDSPRQPILNLTVDRRWLVYPKFTLPMFEYNRRPLRFLPVTPRRIYDSRTSGSAQMRNGFVDIEIPQLSGAAAVAVTVTVVPQGSLGYLAVWESRGPYMSDSLLNSLDGRVKANSAVVPLGPYGRISVFVTDPADVIVDLNGYFVTASAYPDSLAFYPLTPCRITDTRLANSPLNGPALPAASPRTLPIRSSACGIPASAQAYSLNATVVPNGPLGFLTIWPTGISRPVVSTLNALTGTVTANSAIVPAGTNGSIDVYATDSTHLVLDINGYFAPPGQPGGLSYYLAPCRAIDTRLPNAPTGGPAYTAQSKRDYGIPNIGCGVPSTARAYTVNATVVPPRVFGYLTLWASGTSMPLASTLNAVDGAITSNGAIVPASSDGSIAIFASDATHILLDISGYFAP